MRRPFVSARICENSMCGAFFSAKISTQIYCNPKCRPNGGPGHHALSSTQRGLDYAYRKARLRVLERDRYTCRLMLDVCTITADTVDHIIPRTMGGTNDPENLQAACGPCNRLKGARL